MKIKATRIGDNPNAGADGLDGAPGGGGSGGGATEVDIAQTAHGLAVLDAIYYDGADWVGALADDADTMALGVVVEVADVDNFTYAITGRYTATAHGLTVQEWYFLSDTTAGDLTTTEPSLSQPIVYVEDANTVSVYAYRPASVSGSSATTTLTAKILIEEIENTTAGEFDFDSIPAGYDRLIIEGNIRSDSSITADIGYLFFNTDTTVANYHSQRNSAQNNTAANTEASTPEFAVISGASAPTDAYSRISVVIEEYTGSRIKTAACSSGALVGTTNIWSSDGYMSHDSMTAAITRLRFRTNNHATDQYFGKLKLYGEKEVTLESLFQNGKVEIETITNTTAGEFDFDNIPSGYKRLIIEGTLRGDVSGYEDNVYCIFNTDTTASNYHNQLITAIDATMGAGQYPEASTPLLGRVPAVSSPTDSYGQFKIVVADYDGVNLKTAISTFMSYVNTDAIYNGQGSMVSAITAAITRIRIRTDNHATDQLLGTLTLYGEN